MSAIFSTLDLFFIYMYFGLQISPLQLIKIVLCEIINVKYCIDHSLFRK